MHILCYISVEPMLLQPLRLLSSKKITKDSKSISDFSQGYFAHVRIQNIELISNSQLTDEYQ